MPIILATWETKGGQMFEARLAWEFVRLYLQNNQSKNGLDMWLKWSRPCFASTEL
jgi:hypothetical protein